MGILGPSLGPSPPLACFPTYVRRAFVGTRVACARIVLWAATIISISSGVAFNSDREASRTMQRGDGVVVVAAAAKRTGASEDAHFITRWLLQDVVLVRRKCLRWLTDGCWVFISLSVLCGPRIAHAT